MAAEFRIPQQIAAVGHRLSTRPGMPDCEAFLAAGRRARWRYSPGLPVLLARLAVWCRADLTGARGMQVCAAGWRLPWPERLAVRLAAVRLVVGVCVAVLTDRESPLIDGPGVWAIRTGPEGLDTGWRLQVDDLGGVIGEPVEDGGAGLLAPAWSPQPEWRPADPAALIGPPPTPPDTNMPAGMAGMPRAGTYGGPLAGSGLPGHVLPGRGRR